MAEPWHLLGTTWEQWDDVKVGDTVHVGLLGKREVVTGKTTGSYWNHDSQGPWPYFETRDAE